MHRVGREGIRAITVFALVLLLAGGGLAGSGKKAGKGEETSSEAQTSTPQPRIQIDQAVVDLGEIREGKPLVHDFVVKNVGDAPLHIRSVKPG